MSSQARACVRANKALQSTEEHDLRRLLSRIARKLELLDAIITTVEHTLLRQNADMDASFALTLRWCSDTILFEERQRIENTLIRMHEIESSHT